MASPDDFMYLTRIDCTIEEEPERKEPETQGFWLDTNFCAQFGHHMMRPPTKCPGCELKAREIKEKWLPSEDTNARPEDTVLSPTELRQDDNVQVDAHTLPNGTGG